VAGLGQQVEGGGWQRLGGPCKGRCGEIHAGRIRAYALQIGGVLFACDGASRTRCLRTGAPACPVQAW